MKNYKKMITYYIKWRDIIYYNILDLINKFNGIDKYEKRYIDGKLYRLHREYHNNIMIDTYFKNIRFGRIRGLYFRYIYIEGQKCQEVYYMNNKKHREDGPAEIWYRDDEKYNEIYYLYNNFYFNRKYWIEELKKIKSSHYQKQKDLYEIEKSVVKYNL